MLLSRNKKIIVYPCKPQFCYIKVGLKGVNIIWACFRDVHVLQGRQHLWRHICCFFSATKPLLRTGLHYWKANSSLLERAHFHKEGKTILSYDVAVNQWITSCHKKRITTRYVILWREQITSKRCPCQPCIFCCINVNIKSKKILLKIVIW